MSVATIYIENEPREADPKQNLLHVCLSLGYDLPYFCWHPALGSVGACRQCAVTQYKDENDTRGRLVMACMTPVSEGTRISIKDPEAADFRAAVIQGLMQNHPHDCPVCDEGGECHLQDMTVMTGHKTRIYSFGKRTFRNQYLGPLINHEMNRCIQCQRCVRFYREYAGGHDLNAFRLRDTVYFGRQQDGVLESEFSGNLVEVCPTGVFTDATLKHHYTRKWDLQMAPSVCPHCAVGCNISAGERYGALRRVINRYNGHVNGYFLCDRGRFGYEFVNSAERIRQPLVNRSPVEPGDAVQTLSSILKAGHMVGIGSPRASLENNFALRELVGSDNFYAGVSEPESRLFATTVQILRDSPVPVASLQDIENADAVLILGEDVTQTAPIMGLRIRQAVRQASLAHADRMRIPRWLDHAVRELAQEEKSPLFIASPYATRLDDVAGATLRLTPAEISRLGFAIANAIDADAPVVADLAEETSSLATLIAGSLKGAERPLVVSGVSSGEERMLEAAAQVAWALSKHGRSASLAFVVPESNSLGLALLEAPSLSAAFARAEDQAPETVVILENDLFRRAPTPRVESFLQRFRNVVILDGLSSPTSMAAGLVLSSATYAESEGTFVSYEGRAQRYYKVFAHATAVQESWHWLRDAASLAGDTRFAAWLTVDDVIRAMTNALPQLAAVSQAAPSRTEGTKIAREPFRYSGRTSMLANISVHEPKPPEDEDSALAFSMESGPQPPPPPLIPFFWAPGWNSIQSINKFQAEIGGPLQGGDPGVRLFESRLDAPRSYFASIPSASRPRSDAWRLVSSYHLFGSEELSRHAPGIAELAPHPYVAMNPTDAAVLRVGQDDLVTLSLEGDLNLTLNVILRPDLARGLLAIPSGIPPMEGLDYLPVSKLSPAAADVSTKSAL
jgi:NADH-quinone oxidoreductase subunit G